MNSESVSPVVPHSTTDEAPAQAPGLPSQVMLDWLDRYERMGLRVVPLKADGGVKKPDWYLSKHTARANPVMPLASSGHEFHSTSVAYENMRSAFKRQDPTKYFGFCVETGPTAVETAKPGDHYVVGVLDDDTSKPGMDTDSNLRGVQAVLAKLSFFAGFGESPDDVARFVEACPKVLTPSGAAAGRTWTHLYFQIDMSGWDAPLRKAGDAPFMDLKVNSGEDMCVAPPSKGYDWVGEVSFETCPVIPAAGVDAVSNMITKEYGGSGGDTAGSRKPSKGIRPGSRAGSIPQAGSTFPLVWPTACETMHGIWLQFKGSKSKEESASDFETRIRPVVLEETFVQFTEGWVAQVEAEQGRNRAEFDCTDAAVRSLLEKVWSSKLPEWRSDVKVERTSQGVHVVKWTTKDDDGKPVPNRVELGHLPHGVKLVDVSIGRVVLDPTDMGFSAGGDDRLIFTYSDGVAYGLDRLLQSSAKDARDGFPNTYYESGVRTLSQFMDRHYSQYAVNKGNLMYLIPTGFWAINKLDFKLRSLFEGTGATWVCLLDTGRLMSDVGWLDNIPLGPVTGHNISNKHQAPAPSPFRPKFDTNTTDEDAIRVAGQLLGFHAPDVTVGFAGLCTAHFVAGYLSDLCSVRVPNGQIIGGPGSGKTDGAVSRIRALFGFGAPSAASVPSFEVSMTQSRCAHMALDDLPEEKLKDVLGATWRVAYDSQSTQNADRIGRLWGSICLSGETSRPSRQPVEDRAVKDRTFRIDPPQVRRASTMGNASQHVDMQALRLSDTLVMDCSGNWLSLMVEKLAEVDPIDVSNWFDGQPKSGRWEAGLAAVRFGVRLYVATLLQYEGDWLADDWNPELDGWAGYRFHAPLRPVEVAKSFGNAKGLDEARSADDMAATVLESSLYTFDQMVELKSDLLKGIVRAWYDRYPKGVDLQMNWTSQYQCVVRETGAFLPWRDARAHFSGIQEGLFLCGHSLYVNVQKAIAWAHKERLWGSGRGDSWTETALRNELKALNLEVARRGGKGWLSSDHFKFTPDQTSVLLEFLGISLPEESDALVVLRDARKKGELDTPELRELDEYERAHRAQVDGEGKLALPAD